MNKIMRMFNDANRRDAQFFAMRPVDYHGETAVEVMFLTPLGEPLVIRVPAETAGFFAASIRDAADGWATRMGD